jgi:hypothetical protein
VGLEPFSFLVDDDDDDDDILVIEQLTRVYE